MHLARPCQLQTVIDVPSHSIYHHMYCQHSNNVSRAAYDCRSALWVTHRRLLQIIDPEAASPAAAAVHCCIVCVENPHNSHISGLATSQCYCCLPFLLLLLCCCPVVIAMCRGCLLLLSCRCCGYFFCCSCCCCSSRL